MSIIQEALKKIGNISGETKAAANGAKNASGKKIFGPSFYIFIAFLILIYLGVRQFSNTGRDPKAGDVSYPKLLESIYKPISSADANPAEQIQKSPSPKKNRTRFPGFILSGIMQLVDGPRAVINDMIVGVGDVVNGAMVHKISKNGVVLKKKDSDITLAME